MLPENLTRLKIIAQIILISIVGTVLVVGIYAFFIPKSLLDELFVVGASFAIITGGIIYLLQFSPLITKLSAAKNEVRELHINQNVVLASQEKSLKSACNNSIKKLRESEERYALVVKGANKGLWDLNVEGNVLYLSDYWKQILD